MVLYCALLMVSVLMGSQILAIPTPLAQITLYRLLALGVVPILIIQVWTENSSIKFLPRSIASRVLLIYLIWWLLAVLSGFWAVDGKDWFQVIFLMTLGIFSILAFYLWVDTWAKWQQILQAAWWGMTALVIWGYFEIITNTYLLADLTKLDKYRTFASQPMTRIPITTFANQNDYATLLLAYLVVCACLYFIKSGIIQRIIYLVMYLLAAYLIYRTDSRMSLICMLAFSLWWAMRSLKWGFTKRQIVQGLFGIGLIIGMLLLIPKIREKVSSIIYLSGPSAHLSGDAKRMNIWRNGLLFLGQTYGFGVGAGNIEVWAKNSGFWPTNEITNMHNWWLEILVSTGVVPFILYVWGYFSLTRRLSLFASLRKHRIQADVAYCLVGFLLVFILGSITSANNMLIEWHWVFFALIIAFVKIIDQDVQLETATTLNIANIGKDQLLY